MSLQITPGAGGNVALQGVGTTTTTPSTGTSSTVVPSYQIDFAGLSRATSLGLSQPSSVGDLEIIFAQISTALKETLDVLAGVEDEGKAERFRGELGQALASFDQMVRWGDTLDVNRANIVTQREIETAQTIVRDEANALRLRLEAERQPKQEQFNANNAQITTLNGQITSLQQESSRLNSDRIPLANERQALWNELARLTLPAGATRINQINARLAVLNPQIQTIDNRLQAIPGEISIRQGSINSFTAANQTLASELSTLDGRISTARQEAQIAQGKIDAATRSREISEGIERQMVGLMANFVEETIPLAILALGNTRSEMGRDAAGITVQTNSFDELLSAMARAFSEIGAALSQTQLGSDVALHTSGAGLNQTQSTPDRFGQLSAPVARAIAFAGMIAGVLGAVADLVSGLGRGLGMQTAGAMAGAGEPRVRVGL